MREGQKTKAFRLFFETLSAIEQKKPPATSLKTKSQATSLGIQESFESEKSSAPLKKKLSSRKKGVTKASKPEPLGFSQAVLDMSVQNCLPYLEVRKVRISGTTRQIPSMLKGRRQLRLAIGWLLEATQQRKKKSTLSFEDCFALELLEASNKQGPARQRRNELHKIAHSNRTYLRYRWW